MKKLKEVKEYIAKYWVKSSSNPNKKWLVSKNQDGSLECSCPAWIHKFPRVDCKHCLQVLDYEEDGSNSGNVEPVFKSNESQIINTKKYQMGKIINEVLEGKNIRELVLNETRYSEDEYDKNKHKIKYGVFVYDKKTDEFMGGSYSNNKEEAIKLAKDEWDSMKSNKDYSQYIEVLEKTEDNLWGTGKLIWKSW